MSLKTVPSEDEEEICRAITRQTLPQQQLSEAEEQQQQQQEATPIRPPSEVMIAGVPVSTILAMSKQLGSSSRFRQAKRTEFALAETPSKIYLPYEDGALYMGEYPITKFTEGTKCSVCGIIMRTNRAQQQPYSNKWCPHLCCRACALKNPLMCGTCEMDQWDDIIE